MSVLQFISSLVGALAWPASVLALVFILRKPLVKMLNTRPVKILKAGPSGLEVEYFDEKLEDARDELKAGHTERAGQGVPVLPEAPPREHISDGFTDEMERLARISPSAAIMESFIRLEKTLRENVKLRPEDLQRHPATVRELAREARKQNLITSAEYAAFQDVNDLRNVVAHTADGDIDANRALEYANLVRQLIIAISLASGKTAQDGPIK